MYLYILVSLAVVLLFALGCAGPLRRRPGLFYGLAVVLVLAEIIYYQFGLRDMAPEWVTTYLVNPWKRGAISTALFLVVMYLGALDGRHPLVKTLMGVRGQLSILACLFTLGHNFIYGKKHFVRLFTDPWSMKPQTLVAAILSIVMIALMLPLMVTSFQGVRRRMSPRSWKGLQRLAYPFFGLIYVHIMVLFLPNWEKKAPDIVVYTALFTLYLVLRLAKARRSRSLAAG